MGSYDIETLANELDVTMHLVRELVHEVQVGAAVDQVRGRAVELADRLAGRPDWPGLPAALVQASFDFNDALRQVRQSREALQIVARDHLESTHRQLIEVTSATEIAAMSVMDGVDRSLGLITELEHTFRSAGAGPVLRQLRDELNQLFSHLQFQDITSQQLSRVGASLEEIERRMLAAATAFFPSRTEAVV